MIPTLHNPKASLTEVMNAVRELETKDEFTHRASLGIAANVTLNLFDQFLKRHAYIHDVGLSVSIGNYDDLLGDLRSFEDSDVTDVLILLFFDNLMPALESQVATLSPETLEAKREDIRGRLRLAFEQGTGFRTLYVSTFHRMSPALGNRGGDEVSDALADFNLMLREEVEQASNVELLDFENILASVGRANAFDWRFYAQAKAPYNQAFLDELARHLVTVSRGYGTYFHKALVLDCDNTLWGGIIGEDFLDGIKLGPHDYPGNIYWAVQQEILGLQKRGVLLCLCSKNNPEDVQNVLDNHPHMVIRKPHVVLQKVNWEPKVQNIREIARALNIGLDSLVFIDDSDFECNAVRSQLPAVHTVQVPKRVTDYLPKIREISEMFVGGGILTESRKKTEQYRLKAKSEQERSRFDSHDEYLESLELQVVVGRDSESRIKRISELTMKSNQFNLTTRRYTEADIQGFFDDPAATVYAYQIGDKFGDYGLTGIIIVKYDGPDAQIDSFLMSCRVLGRNIELAIWEPVLGDVRRRGCTHLLAEHIPTAKNAQTQDFYDRLGFTRGEQTAIENSDDEHRNYRTLLSTFEFNPHHHVTLSDG